MSEARAPQAIHWRGVGTLFALALLLPASCIIQAQPSQQHHQCVTRCQEEKDTCMLEAKNAEEIQQCDQSTTDCLHSCPQ